MQKANKEELSSLRNKLLAEQVQEQIYQHTLETPAVAGAKLPNEFELGDRLSVRRSTIQEAVKLLISRGILEVRRGSGTYVVSTTPMDTDPLGLGVVEDKMALVLDLVDIRVVLESGITEMAALNITQEDTLKLRNLCDSVERRIKTGDSHIEDDIALRICAAEYPRNKVVEQLIPIIDTAVLVLVNVTHKKLTDGIIMTHQAVAKATAEHDSIGVKTAMIMYMTFNRSTVRQLMKDGREA